jgi:hydroxymethylglutaryl-CoA reductase
MEKQRRNISGFSRLTKSEKIAWLVANFGSTNGQSSAILESYWHADSAFQAIFDAFSENTLSNYHLPYGIAPNFLIDGTTYAVPMVIEESSVVAAASSAAKYWQSRGGFHTEILGTTKIGQVSFKWTGGPTALTQHFEAIRSQLFTDTADITANMVKRGGGIQTIELVDLTRDLAHTYQLKATFETCDSMGANFINTCLEQFASTLVEYIDNHQVEMGEGDLQIIMCILSNYTDTCVVKAYVECPIAELKVPGDTSEPRHLAEKFKLAIDIATIDTYRAVTHNKGIFNGIDAVVLATGNDFRAIEACGHAYAARSGKYRSLSTCTVVADTFRFELEIPMALGTVGGLTSLHPLAKLSLDILDNPSSEQLMSIVAATGLAQNFAAVKSLITTGIQQGHMKMHLQNILNQLGATDQEKAFVEAGFSGEAVSYSKVRNMLEQKRGEV